MEWAPAAARGRCLRLRERSVSMASSSSAPNIIAFRLEALPDELLLLCAERLLAVHPPSVFQLSVSTALRLRLAPIRKAANARRLRWLPGSSHGHKIEGSKLTMVGIPNGSAWAVGAALPTSGIVRWSYRIGSCFAHKAWVGVCVAAHTDALGGSACEPQRSFRSFAAGLHIHDGHFCMMVLNSGSTTRELSAPLSMPLSLKESIEKDTRLARCGTISCTLHIEGHELLISNGFDTSCISNGFEAVAVLDVKPLLLGLASASAAAASAASASATASTASAATFAPASTSASAAVSSASASAAAQTAESAAALRLHPWARLYARRGDHLQCHPPWIQLLTEHEWQRMRARAVAVAWQ